jgi:hypothetical protein
MTFSILFQGELSTCGIDIIPHRVTDCRGDTDFLESFLEFLYDKLTGWLIAVPEESFSRIVGNEVHMSQSSLEQIRELSDVFESIGYS